MPKVFVSYRRSDSREQAVRIADDLTDEFGAGSVFFDTDSMAPGDAFPKEIAANIASSTHVLVVIGPDWMAKNPETGIARIEEPDDWVRNEVHAALSHSAKVIPVLVENAQMPEPTELPLDIRAVTAQNAVELRPDRFKGSLTQLLDRLRDRSAVYAAAIVLVVGVIAAAFGITLTTLYDIVYGLLDAIAVNRSALADLAQATGHQPGGLQDSAMPSLARSAVGTHMAGNLGNGICLAILAYGALTAARSYLPLAHSLIIRSVLIGLCGYVAVDLLMVASIAEDAAGTWTGVLAALFGAAKLGAFAAGILWTQRRSLRITPTQIATMAVLVLAAGLATSGIHATYEDVRPSGYIYDWTNGPPRICLTAIVYDPCTAVRELVHVITFVWLVLAFALLLPHSRIVHLRVLGLGAAWAMFAGLLILFHVHVIGPDSFFAHTKLTTALVAGAIAFTFARWHVRRPEPVQHHAPDDTAAMS